MIGCGKILFVGALFASFGGAALAEGTDAGCLKSIRHASHLEQVPLSVLRMISGVESGLRPFAVNLDGEGFQPRSLADAKRLVTNGYRSGVRSIDVGCMQISLKHHAAEFRSLDEAFDPSSNALYAARFLKKLKERHGTWGAAVAHYHSSDLNRQYEYLGRILRQAGGR